MIHLLPTHQKKLIVLMLILLLMMLLIAPTFASSTEGGGLPFDAYLTKIRQSITGPFAFTASILGIVAAGAGLIFGQELSVFFKTLIYITLILSFVIAAPNTLSAISGKGAEVSPIIKRGA